MEQEIQQKLHVEHELQEHLQEGNMFVVDTPTDYEKATGVANMTGELYEVKMAALLFLRGLNTTKSFLVASSLKPAGVFNDIVFRLGNKTVFMQLKHRENTKKVIEKKELVKEKGNFSLLRYFKSYCEVKQQWAENKDLKFCGNFEDAMFILYTNATITSDADGIVGNTEWHDILSTGSGGNCLYFTEDTCPLKDVLTSADLPDYGNFLSRLLFFTEQAAEDQLDHFIRQELRTACGTDKECNLLVTKVQDWWRLSKSFLTEKVQFWQDIVQSCVASISEQKLKDFEKLPIKFHREVLEQLRVELPPSSGFLHIHTKGTDGNNALTSLKVHQTFGSEPHLLVDGRKIQICDKEVMTLWGRWCNILVVIEDGFTPADFLHGHSGKRLVYISDSRPQHTWTTLRDEPDLKQLDEVSQTKVMAVEVCFQGHYVPFKAVIGSNQDPVFSDVIFHLLTDKIVLGDALTRDLVYYIPRTLQFSCYVKQDILFHKTTNTPVTLAVSGLSKSELQQLVSTNRDICMIDTMCDQEFKCNVEIIASENDFCKLAESCNTIHWCHWEKNGLVWEQSRGNMNIILQYLDNETLLFQDVNSVMDVHYHVALVSAEPGMGKSTLLTHLAQGTKKNNPVLWVVRVNLNDFTRQLDKLPKNLELEHVFQFLLDVSGITPEWKPLFHYKLAQMENVCIMFDGYDEISPTHADKVALMLKFLQNTKLQKLWVTTRPVMRHRLEQVLSTLALTMKPFIDKDQRIFLDKFWKKTMPAIKKSHLNNFINKLLRLTERNLNDREKEFTGQPLQSMLLAEAFMDDLKTYTDTGEMKILPNFDLFQLYSKFVDRKLEIYCTKNNIDLSKPDVLRNFDKMKKEVLEDHMIAALFVLLPFAEIDKLSLSEYMRTKFDLFVNKIQEGKEKTGIIKQIVNGNPLFIHRTFAEYFAALWFANNFLCVKDHIKEKLLDPNFQIVRIFFDRILAQNCELHVAVLNQDIRLVEMLLSKKELDINEKDKGGRTALHLAVLCHLSTDSGKIIQQIVMILLKHGADPNIEDKVFCWRPLRLADSIGAWSAAEMLLKRSTDNSDLVFTIQNINNDDYIQNVLGDCARQGFVQLVTVMLKHGIQVGCCISVTRGLFGRPECHATMLHEAAEHGQLELVQFLVENKADIEAQDSEYKRTALMWAAEHGELHIVKFLKEQGASISTCDKWGNTALQLASQNGKLDVIKFLVEHTDMTADGCNILHCAAESGNVDLVTHLLDLNLNINCLNDYQETPLWRAAWFGQIQVVQLLCERGADLKKHCSMYSPFRGLAYTALHAAVRRGHLQIVQYLVKCGANLGAQDSWGRSPLDIALWFKGNEDVVEFLQSIKHNNTQYVC